MLGVPLRPRLAPTIVARNTQLGSVLVGRPPPNTCTAGMDSMWCVGTLPVRKGRTIVRYSILDLG
jgi:hypothetical protein